MYDSVVVVGRGACFRLRLPSLAVYRGRLGPLCHCKGLNSQRRLLMALWHSFVQQFVRVNVHAVRAVAGMLRVEC
jgi:hypothetical protein